MIFFLKMTFLIIQLLMIIIFFIQSFLYLLFCSIRQLLFRKKISFPRTGSGFLNESKKGETSKTNRISLIINLENSIIYISKTKIEGMFQSLIIENKIFIYKRPYLDIFINSLSQYFDLIIYTTIEKETGEKIIDYIDKNKIIKKRIFKNYMIDNKIEIHKSKKLLITDNESYTDQILKENIIKISSWNGLNKQDDSLLKIKNILQNNFYYGDVNDISDIAYTCNCSDI